MSAAKRMRAWKAMRLFCGITVTGPHFSTISGNRS
jgi:hypothetical protein